ncbi:hypothetical protein WJU23_13790 [Prosthecobacter sp. SYSU 5D2]|uniref:hypothetical protein n=1 Tax=Prosthecobacter sp. SYSU 5D2 TaxID=3134134 RepID=UPI0031FF1716
MPLLTPSTLRVTGWISVFLGVTLLGVACLGQWTSFGDGASDVKRDWELFEPGLVTQVQDYSALVKAVDAKMAGQPDTPAARMQVMYDLIVNRFTHNEALHNLGSNWILYLAGYAHPTFRHMWDPGRFVSQGYSLFCDQSSYLLLHLAMAHDIKARHVGLQGHVVMEAWYDGDWHLYDPDLEVIPVNDEGQVLSLEELAQDQKLLDRYYGPHNLQDLIRNRENHLYMSTPEGARFEWKGNILALVEKAAEILKFVLPVLMIALGLWLCRKTRPISPQPTNV